MTRLEPVGLLVVCRTGLPVGLACLGLAVEAIARWPFTQRGLFSKLNISPTEPTRQSVACRSGFRVTGLFLSVCYSVPRWRFCNNVG